MRVSPRHLDGIKVPFPLREGLTVLENGGRSHQLNESISSDTSMLIPPLLDVLDPQDRLGVFAYDDSVRTVADFDTPHDQWSLALGRLPKPKFSEANFYDATLTVLGGLAGTEAEPLIPLPQKRAARRLGNDSVVGS